MMQPLSNSQQTDIFGTSEQQQDFAELCTALYEKALAELAEQPIKQVEFLQKRLGSLPYHVRLAANKLLSGTSPLDIDIHNGSWQSKQKNKCMASLVSQEDTQKWLSQFVTFGLALPVHLSENGLEFFELDSVDRIDAAKQRFHLNKHGWFDFSGSSQLGKNEQSNPPSLIKRVCKPTKGIMSASCSGHCWTSRGKTNTRRLTLRELLLSTTLDWKSFRKPIGSALRSNEH